MSSQHRSALRLAALLIPGLLVAAAVYAEDAQPPDPPPEAPAKSKPWPAPVGHRQPRAADVTGQAPKDEFAQRLDRINRSLDQQLQICRRC